MLYFNKSKAFFTVLFFVLLTFVVPFSYADDVLDLLHVNDTHSHIEATLNKLTLDLGENLGKKAVYVKLGGFPQLIQGVEQERKLHPNALLVHAGDSFQGTLYFNRFEGQADTEFWNLAGVQAMTLGNHEFDRGPGILDKNLLGLAKFPVVDANVDLSKVTGLKNADKLKPFTVVDVQGMKIGIIGLTTLDTPNISSPGDKVKFLDPVVSTQKAVDALLAQGVNKIIVLSHLGYLEDQKLIQDTTGVDIVVGGHSHTLLGDFSAFGYTGDAYPTVVTDKTGRKVYLVQAWEWAKVMGRSEIHFDAQGEVSSFIPEPAMVVEAGFFRVYDLPNLKQELKRVQFVQKDKTWEISEYDGKVYQPVTDQTQWDAYKLQGDLVEKKLESSSALLLVSPNEKALQLLGQYSPAIKEFSEKLVAQVGEDLKRKNNLGPGPLVAESMCWKTQADVAIMNPGGIRCDLNAGPLSVAGVYELQPFANTLVLLKVTGRQLVNTLEDMVDFSIAKSGLKTKEEPLVYVDGVKFNLDLDKPKNQRVNNVLARQNKVWAPVDFEKVYTLVVNNYMASGGDKNDTLKSVVQKLDTEFIDSEAMLEYVQGKTIVNPKDIRVTQ